MYRMQFQNEGRRELLKLWSLLEEVLKLLGQSYRKGARLIGWKDGNLAEQEPCRPVAALRIAPCQIRIHRHRRQGFIRNLSDRQNKQ